MPTVMYIATLFPESRGVKWVTTFRKYGFKVVVLRARSPEIEVFSGQSGLTIETIKGLNTKLLLDPRVMRAVSDRVRLYAPDFLFVRDIFLAGYGLGVSKRQAIPCCVDVADNYPEVLLSILPRSAKREALVRILNAWEGWALRKATAVIVVSPESRNYLIRKHGLTASKVFTVENVPDEIPINKPVSRSFRGRLVYLGTYDRGIRDLDTVIRGLKLYRREFGHPVTLDIYTFNVKEVQEVISGYGEEASSLITTFPVVPYASLQTLLQQFDAGVVPHCRCPATEYTVPNKLYDYLYSALPVLASNNPPLRRVLSEIGGGVTYSCGDPADFARALCRLKAEIIEGKNRANVSLLASKYSWRNQVEPFLEFVVNII